MIHGNWILLWIDEKFFPIIRSQITSFWQKLKQSLKGGKLKIKIPILEYETDQIFTSKDFNFFDVIKVSEQLEIHTPSEVYKRFASVKDPKQFIIQVEGDLWYPMWAPNYIKCMCRFLLNLPEIPDNLRRELEAKLKLPDIAIQYEFSKAMEEGKTYSFEHYFRWAREKYPGIDEDFRRYISEQKPGLIAQIGEEKYCVAHFGHPSKPELFVYFPIKARGILPPPNGYIHGKVIGVLSFNPSPPLPEMMPRIYLRAACLFGRF